LFLATLALYFSRIMLTLLSLRGIQRSGWSIAIRNGWFLSPLSSFLAFILNTALRASGVALARPRVGRRARRALRRGNWLLIAGRGDAGARLARPVTATATRRGVRAVQ